ncbi:MAG TPA: alpha/beta fold hydrolase, partial [Cryptosporangiaceae bacterium]|nr:alpha/beta fold hydrolase [Cryptosporangiaceae bacterium]
MSVLPGAEPFLLDAGPAAPAGIVLCHGFTGCPQSMRPWGEYLYAAGFTVACPRLPGHGTRWQDLNATRWEDWYDELERAFDAMLDRMSYDQPRADGSDAAPVFAGGLSMGGTLVTRLAEERGQELAGMVLVNPSYLTLRRDAALLPALSRVVSSVPGIGSDIKKAGVTELAYPRTPLKAAFSLNRLWRLTREDLPKVRVPVRVYRSAEDHVVEPVNTRLLLDRISSTDVEETVLTDSYHVATLDNEAETIFAGSVDFIRARLAQLAEQESS